MDKREFDSLLEEHHRRVINIAYRFLNNHAEAEDIAQEVFLRAYRSLSRYEPRAKYSTYLYKITKNLCLNNLRRKKLVQFFSLNRMPDDPEEKIPDFPDKKNISPREILEKEEIRNVIWGSLKKLPANQRTAVILARYEDLSLEEIGEVLGCSIGAVKSLMQRAKIRLKKELEPYMDKFS